MFQDTVIVITFRILLYILSWLLNKSIIFGDCTTYFLEDMSICGTINSV